MVYSFPNRDLTILTKKTYTFQTTRFFWRGASHFNYFEPHHPLRVDRNSQVAVSHTKLDVALKPKACEVRPSRRPRIRMSHPGCLRKGSLHSLELTASLPLKIGHPPKNHNSHPQIIHFQVRTVSFRECTYNGL